jgi:hypothetical protein
MNLTRARSLTIPSGFLLGSSCLSVRLREAGQRAWALEWFATIREVEVEKGAVVAVEDQREAQLQLETGFPDRLEVKGKAGEDGIS